MNHISPVRSEVSFSKIVGIYLTELDHIMVKIRMSDGTFMNFPMYNLEKILPLELSELERDLTSWRFVPCGE
jgi:hypothetical protein